MIDNREIRKFRKEFQKDLRMGKKVIVIPKEVVQEFEWQCIESTQKWANALHKWRALSANSNIL